jgi:glycosyltransferase involved in cell wall biosynthesis
MSRSDVALLTGGGDRPYALGLALACASAGFDVDFVGSDDLEDPELRRSPRIRFLNLRGDMNPGVSPARKLMRVLRYYARLIAFAATTAAPTFHILWNNRFEYFDRTLLMFYYRALGKRVVMTVHNVNVGRRDGHDGPLNRATLKIQYRLAQHLFVHTAAMRDELVRDFDVPSDKVSVIPFGINDTVPRTDLDRHGARRLLGLPEAAPVFLFFGNIAPYKGLEYLVDAMPAVLADHPECRLVVAGRPKGAEDYWRRVEARIDATGIGPSIVRRIEFVPDAETEVYFKAADLLVLPYVDVFQSGVLFLGYSFGLPVLVTNVGSLAEDVVVGETGFVCEPRSSIALAAALAIFVSSRLYTDRDRCRPAIRQFADERYSWSAVVEATARIYQPPCASATA